MNANKDLAVILLLMTPLVSALGSIFGATVGSSVYDPRTHTLFVALLLEYLPMRMAISAVVFWPLWMIILGLTILAEALIWSKTPKLRDVVTRCSILVGGSILASTVIGAVATALRGAIPNPAL